MQWIRGAERLRLSTTKVPRSTTTGSEEPANSAHVREQECKASAALVPRASLKLEAQPGGAVRRRRDCVGGAAVGSDSRSACAISTAKASAIKVGAWSVAPSAAVRDPFSAGVETCVAANAPQPQARSSCAPSRCSAGTLLCAAQHEGTPAACWQQQPCVPAKSERTLQLVTDANKGCNRNSAHTIAAQARRRSVWWMPC